MKIRIFLLIMVSFCLLSCGQKDSGNELPAPPGAEVLKPGEGGPGTRNWTTKTISEGLLLHMYSGHDQVTGKYQNVCVLDVDLNKDRYRIEFCVQEGSNKATSTVQKENGAVAALNATYERASVFIKANGKTYHNIENDLISNAVDNWKNDGAIFLDADGKIYLEHSGKGKKLSEQRTYYRGHQCPNIFSSAPMLINDYDPVGETFVPVTMTEAQFEANYHYEHPYRHQGVTHPRTAVALTEDNHLLLITIDKDRDKLTIAGMTAKQVTQFLKLHFNPQYALNMDGGGSTTLSVNGKVMNKPSGGSERTLPTHILVFDDQKK
mgnify:FL=1